MIFDIRKGAGARFEPQGRAGLVGLADDGERCFRLPMPVFLLVDLAVAMDRQYQVFRQRVYHGNADAVQTTGNLV